MKLSYLFCSLLSLSSVVYGQTRQDDLRAGEWSPDNFETLFSNPVCPEQIFVSYRSAEAPSTKLTLASGDLRV